MDSCPDYLLSAISSQEQLTDLESQELRHEYLSVVQSHERLEQWVLDRKKNIRSFQTALIPFSLPIVPSAYTSTNTRKRTSVTTILSIGRRKWCDIQTKQSTISRLHALLFKVHNAHQKPVFAVLDFWSLNGTKIGPHASTPQSRHIIYHDADTPFVLGLGGESLQLPLNLQDCLICTTNPRDTVFGSCGHFVTCRPCAARLQICPLCQSTISKVRIHNQHEYQTYEGPCT